jgi:hypothetical protein
MGETKFEKKPQVTKSQGLAVIFGVGEFSSFCEKRFRTKNIPLRIIRKTPQKNSIKQLSKTRHLSNITKIEEKKQKQKDKSLRTSRDKGVKHAWKETASLANILSQRLRHVISSTCNKRGVPTTNFQA